MEFIEKQASAGLIVRCAETQGTEKGADILDQQRGLLESREVATLGNERVVAQVEGALDPFLGRRRSEIGREGGEAGRRLDPLALVQGTVLLLRDAAVEPGRRPHGAG